MAWDNDSAGGGDFPPGYWSTGDNEKKSGGHGCLMWIVILIIIVFALTQFR